MAALYASEVGSFRRLANSKWQLPVERARPRSSRSCESPSRDFVKQSQLCDLCVSVSLCLCGEIVFCLIGILPDDLKVHNWLSHSHYLLYLLGLVVRLTSIDTTKDLASLGHLPLTSHPFFAPFCGYSSLCLRAFV
jgi:hypothetical protein